MMSKQSVLNLGNDGNELYTIQNSDGKKWSFSTNNLKMSFEIYEPSGIKGRLMKKFHFLFRFEVVRSILGIKREKILINSTLKTCLFEYIGENPDFSIFYGTPSTDQKITIQFFNEEKIFCYCKIGKSKRVKELFEKEIKLIHYLGKKGITHIPSVLYSGKINDNYIFVQSTEKNSGAKVLHVMRKSHKLFLDNLYKSTAVDIVYESTQYYELINSKYSSFGMLSIFRQHTIIDVKNRINQKYKNKIISWGVVHGDFVPWNTCQVGKDIFVYDFEYGLLNAPNEIDYWHFIIQTLVYEKKVSINNIAKIIIKKVNNSKLTIEGFEEYILFYVFTYLKRGEQDDINQINIRIDLLHMVNKFKETKQWKKL